MIRNLYRFYLYIIYIALLIFVAIVTGQLLNTLLRQTLLRGSNSGASQAEVVQSLVFAAVAWVIAGVLAGLHYWLIRRDIKNDPAAGISAIRSFFLNITEAGGAAFAIPFIGFFVFGNLGFYPGSDVVSFLAFALPALALVVLLELERRRTKVSSGAALAFQRLHFYGMQILLLIFLTLACFRSVVPLVDGLIFNGRGALDACGGGNACPPYNLFYLAISLLWFVAFWIGYGWLVRNDNSRILRLILHGASFAYGMSFIVAAIYIGVQLIILPLFKLSASLKDIVGPYSQYNFIAPLTVGLLAVGTYHFWLRIAAKQELINSRVLFLTECAIAEIVSAAAFWWGCRNLLYNFFQPLMPPSGAPDAKAWIPAIAFIVAGLGYIPLEFYLLHRNAGNTSAGNGPRRGVVLALLAIGILASTIGGATALYAWLTTLFGSAINNWQRVALSGLAIFIVGVLLVSIYLWFALREHLFRSPDKQLAATITPTAPSAVEGEPPATLTTIEDVLDALLAARLTRDAAAARIRALNKVSVSTENQA